MGIIITELKNLVKGFSSRSKLAEVRIKKLEDRLIEMIVFEEQKEKLRKMRRARETCGIITRVPIYTHCARIGDRDRKNI